MWIMWFIRRFPARERAVAVLLPGGRIEWCGAGPGPEPVAVGEAGDVTNVGQGPGGRDGSDAMKVHQA
jgi:hypothetical protein